MVNTELGEAHFLTETHWNKWKDKGPTEIKELLAQYGIEISRQRAFQIKKQILRKLDKELNG